jgi:hypothetical protein
MRYEDVRPVQRGTVGIVFDDSDGERDDSYAEIAGEQIAGQLVTTYRDTRTCHHND